MQIRQSLVECPLCRVVVRVGWSAVAVTIARSVLIVAALGLGTLESSALGDSSVATVAETELQLTLRLTDARGAQRTLEFNRANAAAAWQGPDVPGAVPGIIFGRADPIYASAARQRSLGISADQTIATFSTAITSRPMSDVTVFRLGGGDMAIALWQGNLVTEIWYVWTLVEEVMFSPGFQGWQLCQRALALCCAAVPNPHPGLGEPTTIPHPRVDACRIVARNCGEAAKHSACDCLNTACNFCFDEPEYCCGGQQPPDQACLTPWLPEESEQACVVGVEVCVEPPAPPVPPQPDPVGALMDEIANRLQVRVDLQNAQQAP